MSTLRSNRHRKPLASCPVSVHFASHGGAASIVFSVVGARGDGSTERWELTLSFQEFARATQEGQRYIDARAEKL